MTAGYKDLNGDGKIDAKVRTQIGKPLPDFTYGINLGASFRGFDLPATEIPPLHANHLITFEKVTLSPGLL